MLMIILAGILIWAGSGNLVSLFCENDFYMFILCLILIKILISWKSSFSLHLIESLK